MKKQVNKMLGFVCYIIGVVCSVYFGLWKMLLIPLRMLYVAAVNGELSATLVIACTIKILFSTTMTGLIWCIGYIAYNHFKGAEDPDWEAIEARRMKRRDEDEKERQAS